MAGRRRKVKGAFGPKGLEREIFEKYAKFSVSAISDERPRRLDPVLRAEMERALGVELSGVRVHTGERAQKMAEALSARAFAIGPKDIFFASGEYAPSTPKGKALLAHELTHIVEKSPGLAHRLKKEEVEEAEFRARKVEEMVLAKEERPEKREEREMLEPVDVEVPGGPGAASGGRGQVVTIDKTRLEEKILQIMERQQKRERERRGLV